MQRRFKNLHFLWQSRQEHKCGDFRDLCRRRVERGRWQLGTNFWIWRFQFGFGVSRTWPCFHYIFRLFKLQQFRWNHFECVHNTSIVHYSFFDIVANGDTSCGIHRRLIYVQRTTFNWSEHFQLNRWPSIWNCEQFVHLFNTTGFRRDDMQCKKFWTRATWRDFSKCSVQYSYPVSFYIVIIIIII